MASETQRKGDWQQTFTGRQFWPLDPRIEDIDIEDIAHALSLQCRFAGHCRTFYSVAEHSVRVSLLIEAWNFGDLSCWNIFKNNASSIDSMFSGWDKYAKKHDNCLSGLLHDASEAYCIDVPRPLKPYLTGYKAIEAGVMSAVERWAGLNPGACSVPAIKNADEVILATEARDLMRITRPWHLKAEPLPDVIRPWPSHTAERRFIDRFNELKGHG